MVEQNKIENPVKGLLYGAFLFIFGLCCLYMAWVLTKSDVNVIVLLCMIVSFVIPAAAAFVLGLKRLVDVANFYKQSS